MDFIEIIGYVASILILISLLMSSIIRLRWINLIGSGVFAIYGFMIGALPVGFVNLAIVIINIYYLLKIYNKKEFFKPLFVKSNSDYLDYYIDFHKNDIKKFFPHFNKETIAENDLIFFVLRNTVPAGIFIAKKFAENSFFVELDFVISEYRDFKVGYFIFEEQKDIFLSKGINKLYAESSDEQHDNYLKKMGFLETSFENKKLLVRYVK